VIYMPVPERQCSKCREWFPMNSECFRGSKNGRGGLRRDCRECGRQGHRKWREDHRQHALDYSKEYVRNNREKVRTSKRARYIRDAAKNREYSRNYSRNNPEKVKTPERAAYYSRWAAGSKEHLKDYKRRHYRNNHDLYIEWAMRRRARKHELPYAFTEHDWRHCLNYWSRRCAYCNTLLEKPAQDHFIPLTDSRPDNPGTVPTNILPACKACNTSKFNHDPLVWLPRKFGPDKAQEILAHIQAYFESLIAG
jgi:hypothetical protein